MTIIPGQSRAHPDPFPKKSFNLIIQRLIFHA